MKIKGSNLGAKNCAMRVSYRDTEYKQNFDSAIQDNIGETLNEISSHSKRGAIESFVM
jgi:hypothetical protein